MPGEAHRGAARPTLEWRLAPELGCARAAQLGNVRLELTALQRVPSRSAYRRIQSEGLSNTHHHLRVRYVLDGVTIDVTAYVRTAPHAPWTEVQVAAEQLAPKLIAALRGMGVALGDDAIDELETQQNGSA